MTLPDQIATAQQTAPDRTVQLRVLATTDLHAHLLPFDYFTDTRDASVGLAQLGAVIDAARGGADNVVLLDNGDTLQGAPLADAAVAEIVPAGRLHPMIMAMNALGFDAATLGNHDFDFGIPHLMASLEGAAFPVVSANSHHVDGTPLVAPRTILTRQVTDNNGAIWPMRVGITGAVPPQVALWNKSHLQGRMAFDDIVQATRREVAALIQEGADLVIVLAHSGCGTLDAGPGAENVALQIAQIAGVDAVVAGHTHKVRAMPLVTPSAGPDADVRRGAPIVQPGAFGSHLGCLDLTLACEPADTGVPGARQWRVRQGKAELLSYETGPRTTPRLLGSYPDLRREIAREHRTTRRHVARPLGESAVPLETYFSVISPCAATQVVADAQHRAAAPLIAQCAELSGLPVLSAVAPFKAGGRSGPGSYTDVPVGALRLRHAADLYLYPNMLSVVRTTGRGIADWLERAASLFHQIDPGADGPRLLINHEFAPYNFDRIVGLRYDIDVTVPPRTDAEGDVTYVTPGRIHNVTLADGTPLAPDTEVLVVTNSYRAAGGGHVSAARDAEEVFAAPFSVRDAVAQHIAQSPGPLDPTVEPTFRLRPLGGTEVVFETGPGALGHSARLTSLGLTPMDPPCSAEGFQRFLMRL